MLPNCIIAGERRCGTSSLARLLAGHPDAFMLPKQDGAWFIDESRRAGDTDSKRSWVDTFDIESYAAMFDQPEAKSCKIVAEKSADYLFWRSAHTRIAEYLPNAKFVVILRDPVERAWSHYWNEISKNRETLSFENALAAEAKRCANSDYEKYNFSYVSRGDYANNLRHFLQHASTESLFVTTVEVLRAQPRNTLNALCLFLGIEPDKIEENTGARRNANWGTVKRPWAQTGFSALMADAYRPFADTAARMIAQDREQKRQLMVKFRSPFFEPARELTMTAVTRRQLTSQFCDQPEKLADLLGDFDTGWSLVA